MKQIKVKLYVDWRNHNIVNDANYREALDQQTKKVATDMDEFDDWLSCHYDPHELFSMNDEEKAVLQKEFDAYCAEFAEDAFAELYDEVTISLADTDFV